MRPLSYIYNLSNRDYIKDIPQRPQNIHIMVYITGKPTFDGWILNGHWKLLGLIAGRPTTGDSLVTCKLLVGY